MEDLMQQPIEQIPNNPLNDEKANNIIKAEDIYIDDSLKDINFFPAPSTDDRRDFEIKVSGGDLIAYKSASLTITNISKKTIKRRS